MSPPISANSNLPLLTKAEGQAPPPPRPGNKKEIMDFLS